MFYLQNPKKHDFLRFFELLHSFSRLLRETPAARYTWVCCCEIENCVWSLDYV